MRFGVVGERLGAIPALQQKRLAARDRRPAGPEAGRPPPGPRSAERPPTRRAPARATRDPATPAAAPPAVPAPHPPLRPERATAVPPQQAGRSHRQSNSHEEGYGMFPAAAWCGGQLRGATGGGATRERATICPLTVACATASVSAGACAAMPVPARVTLRASPSCEQMAEAVELSRRRADGADLEPGPRLFLDARGDEARPRQATT